MTDLDQQLDAWAPGEGAVEVSGEGRSASIDVVDVDRLGVRVRDVRVRHDAPRDVVAEAGALPDRCRSLPGRIEAQEVAPTLGGAILRTPADRMRHGRFFEVEVQTDHTRVRRYEVANGERHPADWTMTREQLDELLHEL